MKHQAATKGTLPHSVQRRILRRCAKGEPVVVVPKHGKPSRVFDINTYIKTVKNAKKVRPWTHRKRRKRPDPLGAIEGRVISTLRREDIYS